MTSCLLRLAIIFIPLNLMEFTSILHSFDHARNIWVFACVWCIRVGTIIPMYAPEGVLPLSVTRVCMISQLFLTPLQTGCYFLLFYNRKTPIAKILAIVLLWEAYIALTFSIASLSVNFLEGYGNASISDVFRPFQPLDLLIPIIMGLLCCPLFLKGSPLFSFIRSYQLRHPLLLSFIVIPLYLIGFITSINPVTYGYFIFYMMSVTVIMMCLIILMFYGHSINIQGKALRTSGKMVADHYQMLQSRIDELQRQQNEINAKMTVLVSANFPEDLTKRYLNDMKHLKDNLYTTLYTHYYMIDAVLSAKAKDYREHQINFECQCEGLALKHLSQVQVSQVLMTLFRYIDQYDNTSVNVKLSSYKNQVIIVLETTDNIGISGLKRQITNQLSNKLLSIQKKKQTLYLSIND